MRVSSMRARSVHLSFCFAIVLILLTNSVHAEGDMPCTVKLIGYKEKEAFAQFELSVDCEPAAKDPSLNGVLMIGLTASIAEEGKADTDYDFALQHFQLEPIIEKKQFFFKAKLDDLVGLNHIETRVWPLYYLQACSEGRSGCRKYGYALDEPEKIPAYCGDSPKFCSPSERFHFKFR